MTVLYQASCVAIGNRAVLIEGPAGSGKSTLALSLIDRGATLIGDDGVSFEAGAGKLYASPAPQIAGLLEVRNLGILTFPTVGRIPVGILIRLDPEAPRYVEDAAMTDILRVMVPTVRLWPDSPPIKAELALKRYGI